MKLVQVIHVLDQGSIDYALQVSHKVDALLLDSGNLNRVVKELGGTGRVHDWGLSQQIAASVDVPVFLAGGLNQSNVQSAINQVKPGGLDLCSSVRSHQLLDQVKPAEFIKKAKPNC